MACPRPHSQLSTSIPGFRIEPPAQPNYFPVYSSRQHFTLINQLSCTSLLHSLAGRSVASFLPLQHHASLQLGRLGFQDNLRTQTASLNMLTAWLAITFKRLQKFSSPLQTGNSNAVIAVLCAWTGPRAANSSRSP